MVIGLDLMNELGIDISFKTKKISWNEMLVPMATHHSYKEEVVLNADDLNKGKKLELLKLLKECRTFRRNIRQVEYETCSR
jgi:hypothetical protein